MVGASDRTRVEGTTVRAETSRYHRRKPCHAIVGKYSIASHASMPYTASNQARGLTAGVPQVGRDVFRVRSVCMRA